MEDNHTFTYPKAYSEFYSHPYSDFKNMVYSENQNNIRLVQVREFSQVFDLNGTALVCIVFGNQLKLQLLHFSDMSYQQFIKAQSLLSGQQPRDPNQTFLQTKEQAYQLFQDLSSAKIEVKGQIIPDLVLNENKKNFSINPSFGFQTIVPFGKDNQEFKLTFLTDAKLLYNVFLDKYYLQNGNTIQVAAPLNLQDLLNILPRSFDMFEWPELDRQIYMVGGSLSNAQIERGESAESQLYLIKSDKNMPLESKQLEKTAIINTMIKNLNKTFKERISNNLSSLFQNTTFFNMGSPKQEQPQVRALNREVDMPTDPNLYQGVVTVKYLGASLFGVVYSTGFFRLWCFQQQKDLLEIDLLQEIMEDDQSDPEQTNSDIDKITNAKIVSSFQMNQIDLINQTHCAKLKLVIAFEVKYNKINSLLKWSLSQQQIKLNHLSQLNNELELMANVRDIQRVHISSEQLNQALAIRDMKLEQMEDDSQSLWVALYNKKNKASKIVDLYSREDNMWDIHNQESYFKIFDKLQLSEELYNKDASYDGEVLAYNIKRMQQLGRFTPIALKQLQFWSQGAKSEPNLEDKIFEEARTMDSRAQYSKKILNQLAKFQWDNSNIQSLSLTMKTYPFKVVVRDQGLYLIKDDSIVSTQQVVAQNVCTKLDNLKGQYDSDKINQILAYEGQVLFKVFGALKFLLESKIYQFETLFLREPQDLTLFIDQMLRDSFENEEVHFELINLIEENRDQLEAELKKYKHDLIVSVLSFQAQQGSESGPFPGRQENISSVSPHYISFFSQSVLQEVNNTYQTLRDIVFLDAYLDIYLPYCNSNSDNYEDVSEQLLYHEELIFWLRQYSGLKFMFESKVNLKILFSNEFVPVSVKNKAKEILAASPKYEVSVADIFFMIDMGEEINNKYEVGWKQFEFERVMNKFKKLYTIRKNLQSEFFIPHLVKRLFYYDMVNHAICYLRSIGQESIGLSFAQAIIAVHFANSQFELREYLENCWRQYKQLDVVEKQWGQLFQMNVSQREIQTFIQNYINEGFKEDTIFMLVILEIFKDYEEPYLKIAYEFALEVLDDLSFNEINHLNVMAYRHLSFQGNEVSKYNFALAVQDLKLRQELLADFVANIFYGKKAEEITFEFYFDEIDLDLILEYFYEVINNQVLNLKKEKNFSQLQDSSKQIKNLTENLNTLSIQYKLDDMIAKFLYKVYLNLEDKINDFGIFNQDLEHVLSSQHYVLNTIQIIAKRKGINYEFVNRQLVKTKIQSKKRSHDEAISGKQIEGFQILNESERDRIFLEGKLKKVDQSSVQKLLNKVEAQIRCLPVKYSNDYLELIQILCELGMIDFAISLGQSCEEGMAYPLVFFANKIMNDEISDLQKMTLTLEKDSYLSSKMVEFLAQFTQINYESREQKTSRIDFVHECVLDYAPIIRPKERLEIAQKLALYRISIPKEIIKMIKEDKELTSLVESMLKVKFVRIESSIQPRDRQNKDINKLETIEILACDILSDQEVIKELIHTKLELLMLSHALIGEFDIELTQRLRKKENEFNKCNEDLRNLGEDVSSHRFSGDNRGVFSDIAGEADQRENSLVKKIKRELDRLQERKQNIDQVKRELENVIFGVLFQGR